VSESEITAGKNHVGSTGYVWLYNRETDGFNGLPMLLGRLNGEEILACEQAGICVTLPKPMTSGAKSEGRFGKQDFVYMPDENPLLLHFA
jgi:hypothetical protein